MSATTLHPHRVAQAVADARAALTDVADVPTWSMRADETRETLAGIAALEAQVAELKARVLAEADRNDAGAATGTAKTAVWHARETRATRRAGFRAMRLAHGLDRHDLTRVAMTQGRVNEDQAHVIIKAVDALPDGIRVEDAARAEAHLISEADHHDAKALQLLGRRLVEVIDPEAADAHEAALLEKEEREAAASTRLTIWDDGRGRTWFKGCTDALTGAMLRKALHAIASPRHRAANGPLDVDDLHRPTPERLGRAFTDYVQGYPTDRLPHTGGLSATVVALIPFETLMGGLAAAHLDTGEPLSPGRARLMACEAGVLPAVLGGKGEVLDLGRTKRMFSRPQRLARSIEVGGLCSGEGCDRYAAHAHHLKPWSQGGTTDLKDLVPACSWHHVKFHDPRYTATRLPSGRFAFHLRT